MLWLELQREQSRKEWQLVKIERHSRMRQIELGRSLLGRIKIYLDACFWIILRDTELGVRTGAQERKLLHFLRRGVRDGRLICPIGASMFMELMKQPFTLNRRRATARLIDELSLGISAIPPHVLMGTEINSFLLLAKQENALHPIQELIWTKVAYVLGNIHPSIAVLLPAEEVELQKAFFDHLWEHSLVDMIDTIGDADTPDDHFRSLSKETNEQNLRYRDELKSFEGAYDTEPRGAIELAGDIAADIIADFAEKEAGRSQRPTAAERTESVNACRNLLYFAMKKPKNRKVLRTLHVGASLHAAMRWDKQRKFKPNDYYDFEHATLAMGYCDAFLTEVPLRVLVTGSQIDLVHVNNCRVISDLTDAAVFVREAAGERLGCRA